MNQGKNVGVIFPGKVRT